MVNSECNDLAQQNKVSNPQFFRTWNLYSSRLILDSKVTLNVPFLFSGMTLSQKTTSGGASSQ